MRGGYQTQADVARRITGFILLLIGLFLMIALYYVKTRAQTARKMSSKLQYEIALEEAAIGVLRAEIAYLESPSRLQDLAGEHLDLAPITTAQMIDADEIAARFPLKALTEEGLVRESEPELESESGDTP